MAVRQSSLRFVHVHGNEERVSRWIFIVEGVITIGFGLLAWIFMSDYPETVSWLTDEGEATFVRCKERALNELDRTRSDHPC